MNTAPTCHFFGRKLEMSQMGKRGSKTAIADVESQIASATQKINLFDIS